MKGLQAQVEGEVLAFTTTEGRQFIGGHGMSEENKLRTASASLTCGMEMQFVALKLIEHG